MDLIKSNIVPFKCVRKNYKRKTVPNVRISFYGFTEN